MNGHLFIAVWDEDSFVRDFSVNHDLIGICALSLESIFKAIEHGKSFDFCQVLLSNGCCNGTLYGTITGKVPFASVDSVKEIRHAAFNPQISNFTDSFRESSSTSCCSLS